MKYLIRLGKKKARAHLWLGRDTVCRLYSTGGIRAKSKFIVCDSPENRPICVMCDIVCAKLDDAQLRVGISDVDQRLEAIKDQLEYSF